MILLVGYSTISTIFYVSFEVEETRTLKAVEGIVFCFFLLEIIFRFVTSYEDPKTNEEVSNLSKIAYNYIFSGRFVIDAVATIPYQFFASYYWVLLRELRIFRITALFDLLDIQRYSKVFYHLINDFYLWNDGSRE